MGNSVWDSLGNEGVRNMGRLWIHLFCDPTCGDKVANFDPKICYIVESHIPH